MAALDVEKFRAGMALQRACFAQALAQGMPRRGWKVGINVPEVLTRLGLPHPGVGWLDGNRILSSGALLVAPEGARLRVEPEVALEITRDVPADCPAGSARACIGAVHPALEIVDYARPGAGLSDVVAHSMFHHAAVLGPAAPPGQARELGVRWPRLRVGEAAAEAPRSDLVPQDLGELVSFVAAFLAAFDLSLAAGDLVLSGSYTAQAVPVAPGAEARAEFGPLGSVSVRIAAAGEPLTPA